MQPTLNLQARVAPPTAEARRILGALFGPQAVRTTGTLGASLEARGVLHGGPFRVELQMAQTQYTGTQPYTVIELEVELDVAVFHGGVNGAYPPHEAFVPFAPPRLTGRGVAGAPRSLLQAIAAGPLAERLAATGFYQLGLGADAKRFGCSARGVHFDVEGWPLDEATLAHLVETVSLLGAAARRETSAFAGGRHPEVAVYEEARARSRAAGIRIVVGVMVGVAVIFVVALTALVAFALR